MAGLVGVCRLFGKVLVSGLASTTVFSETIGFLGFSIAGLFCVLAGLTDCSTNPVSDLTTCGLCLGTGNATKFTKYRVNICETLLKLSTVCFFSMCQLYPLILGSFTCLKKTTPFLVIYVPKVLFATSSIQP